ncbi:MAG: DUF5615 family PIN-like protein [Burkholderiales bacterium]|nr:DUF5615 family PIN-like protein [Burkholderiales bacterium]
MRLLLDESLPWHLGGLMAGHDVTSVQRMGWAGLRNGALLHVASKAFDALITADSNREFRACSGPGSSIQDLRTQCTGKSLCRACG